MYWETIKNRPCQNVFNFRCSMLNVSFFLLNFSTLECFSNLLLFFIFDLFSTVLFHSCRTYVAPGSSTLIAAITGHIEVFIFKGLAFVCSTLAVIVRLALMDLMLTHIVFFCMLVQRWFWYSGKLYILYKQACG
jgi:hypothetical protein